MIVDIQSIIYINMICLGIRIFNAYIKNLFTLSIIILVASATTRTKLLN